MLKLIVVIAILFSCGRKTPPIAPKEQPATPKITEAKSFYWGKNLSLQLAFPEKNITNISIQWIHSKSDCFFCINEKLLHKFPLSNFITKQQIPNLFKTENFSANIFKDQNHIIIIYKNIKEPNKNHFFRIQYSSINKKSPWSRTFTVVQKKPLPTPKISFQQLGEKNNKSEEAIVVHWSTEKNSTIQPKSLKLFLYKKSNKNIQDTFFPIHKTPWSGKKKIIFLQPGTYFARFIDQFGNYSEASKFSFIQSN